MFIYYIYIEFDFFQSDNNGFRGSRPLPTDKTHTARERERERERERTRDREISEGRGRRWGRKENLFVRISPSLFPLLLGELFNRAKLFIHPPLPSLSTDSSPIYGLGCFPFDTLLLLLLLLLHLLPLLHRPPQSPPSASCPPPPPTSITGLLL